MIRVIIAAGFLFSLALAAACSGGDDGSGTVVVNIAPDLSSIPEGLTEADAITGIVTVFEQRAMAYGGSADVRRNDDGTLSVEVSDIAADVAADLFGKTARLRIQAPHRNDPETILCKAADGTETPVPQGDIEYPVTGATRLPRCRLSADVLGDIVWEPLFGDFSEKLTADEVATIALKTEEGPTLLIVYDRNASAVLQAATIQLDGLPMGIFLDGTLIAGPTISEPILSGTIAVAGLSLRDTRILKAQLEAGELPVAVSLA